VHHFKNTLLRIKILFIINPISGGLNKTFIPSLIDQYLDHQKFDADIIYSEYHGHAAEIANKAIISGVEIIAAVGGDGTINEIASEVSSLGKIMAIIPCGSGNGLARTLKIPLSHAKAIARINAFNTVKVDVGTFNGKKFFNMAGMGFDAHISFLFAKSTGRGLMGYVKSIFREIANYKADHYIIEIDGKKIEREAFMLSIANSSQYGNNAHISPEASLMDGLLDVCVIKPFPLWKFPVLGFRMFAKSTPYSKYVEIFKGKYIVIQRKKEGPIHLDGEPFMMEAKLTIEVAHLALELIV